MVVAGLLSSVVPGLGQLYRGATRRGLVLLAIAVAIVVSGLVIGSRLSLDALPGVDRRIVSVVLLADLALLAFRVFAVVDAARGALPVLVAALVVLTAMPHVAAAWVTVRSYEVLESVFADEEPCGTACDRGTLLLSHRVVPLPEWVPKDAWEWALVERLGPGEMAPLPANARVLAGTEVPVARPWTTILLLGTDEGPGNLGARTDTIILAAIQHRTGRAAAFGIPRNLAQIPLGPKGTPFKEPINALYGRSGGGETGARNLKQAVSALLGIRVDYYALVNLVGFADLVDALGGVEILVKERLRDEVTRPAWGEPKPRIDVLPGRTYRFYGREALAYVRPRKDPSDYTQMARQRCFLSAMADQLDPVRAIRNFGSLARTIESNVHTDIPLNRLPSLVRLVGSVDSRETLTVTFGPEYFFGRQQAGNYPVPALGPIQTTVRRAILAPELLQRQGRAKTARQTC
jgi:LCP family protein required for cell wall assembly